MKPRAIVESPLHVVLLGMAVPTIIGFGSGNLASIFEMIFIAPLGRDAIAAMGITGMALFICGFLNEIPGSASVILLSQSIGARQDERSRAIIRQTFYVKFALAMAHAAVLLPILWWILPLMGATDDIYQMSWRYAALVILAQPFSFCIYSVFTVFRGLGQADVAMWCQLVSNLALIVCEWYCIVVLKLGLTGAGVGLLVSQVAVFFVLTAFMASRWCSFPVNIYRNIRFDPVVREMFRVGIPCAGGSLARTIAGMLTGRMIVAASMDVFACLQLFSRVMQLPGVISAAYTLSATPILGQNIGANRKDRVEGFIKLQVRTGTAIIGVMSVVAVAFPEWLLGWFSVEDPELLRHAVVAVRVLAFLPLLEFWSSLIGSFFNAWAETRIPFLAVALPRWLVSVPAVALVLIAWKLDPTLVYWIENATASVTVITLAVLFVAFRSGRLRSGLGKA